MTSDHVHALLPAFRDGDLEPARRDAVAAHLEACPACRDELERYDQALDALAGLAAAPTDAAHVDAVLARLDEAPAPAAGEPTRRPVLTHLAAALLGAAACLLLLLWLHDRSDGGVDPTLVDGPARPDGAGGSAPVTGPRSGEPEPGPTVTAPTDRVSPRLATTDGPERTPPPGVPSQDPPSDPATHRPRELTAAATPATAAAGPSLDGAATDGASAPSSAPTLVWRFDERPLVAVLERLEDRLDAWLATRPERPSPSGPTPSGPGVLPGTGPAVADGSPTGGDPTEGAPADGRDGAPSLDAPTRPTDAALLAQAGPPPAVDRVPDRARDEAPTITRPRDRRTGLPAHAGAGPRARRAGLRADTKLSAGRPAPLTVVNDDELGMTHMQRHESLALVVPSLLVTLREGTPREADLAAAALEDLRDRLLADPLLAPHLRAASAPPPPPEPSWLDALLGRDDQDPEPDAREQLLASHDRWWTAVRPHLDQGL